MRIIGWLALVCGSSVVGQGNPPIVKGSFIALPPPWYQRVYDAPLAQKDACFAALWQREFADLDGIGFKTLIVQFTVDDDHLYFDPHGEITIGGKPMKPETGDVLYSSLGAIMANAEKTGAEIWVGLRQKADWNGKGWPNVVDSADSVIEETCQVARALKSTKLLDTEQFAGWYIVPEIDNRMPDNMTVEAVGVAGKAMLTKLTAGLRAIAEKPVAISGFFREATGNVDEKSYLGLLRATLDGSGIKVFVFQDSVGVEDSPQAPKTSLSLQEIAKLTGRYEGVIRAAGNDIETWADVELMVGEAKDAPATQIERLKDQLAAAKACPKIVVFAASHHMTTLGGRTGANRLFRAFYLLKSGHAYADVQVQACPALKRLD
jgi:Domain of unknown function (DUF4434)